MPWRCVSHLSIDGVHGFLDMLFGDDLHAKRVKSWPAPRSRPRRCAGRPDRPGSGAGTRAAPSTRSSRWTGCCPSRAVDVDALLGHWVPYWSANATASRWRWTGPSSTPTVRRRSCCLCCPATDGPRRSSADRGQGGAEKPSQRLRVSGAGAPGRNPARRCPGAHRGGSRLRRPQAYRGVDRGTEVRLRHPLSR